MIEQIIGTIIEELGATGLLVVGLYVLLYKPLNKISRSLCNINGELERIINLLSEK